MHIKNTKLTFVAQAIWTQKAEALCGFFRGDETLSAAVCEVLGEENTGVLQSALKAPRGQQESHVLVVDLDNKAGRFYVLAACCDAKDQMKPEQQLRQIYRAVFAQVVSLKLKSVALEDLGDAVSFLPPVGRAKILAQEILRFCKSAEARLDELLICLPRSENADLFFNKISGYITHIQDTLGDGPYVTVDIIIEMNDGIIVIERSNPPYGWALPGGFVDCGESLETAAAREAKEETNLDVEQLRQFHVYSDPGRDPRFHTVSTVFIARGVGIPRCGDDAKGLKVVSFDALLKGTYAFDHKEIIADYLQSIKSAGRLKS